MTVLEAQMEENDKQKKRLQMVVQQIRGAQCNLYKHAIIYLQHFNLLECYILTLFDHLNDSMFLSS